MSAIMCFFNNGTEGKNEHFQPDHISSPRGTAYAENHTKQLQTNTETKRVGRHLRVKQKKTDDDAGIIQ